MNYHFGAKWLNMDIRIPRFVRDKTKALPIDTKLKVCVDVVISNLLLRSVNNTATIYSRSKGVKYAYKRNIGVRSVIRVVDRLEKLGLLVNSIGVSSKDANFREGSFIKATDLFKREFVMKKSFIEELKEQEFMNHISVRDSQAPVGRTFEEAIDDAEEDQEEYMRSIQDGVDALNKLNKGFEYSLVLDGHKHVLDNMYCRVYKTDWNSGGRYYEADVLSIKNKTKSRLDIKIDGEDMVEVDFSNLHFRICKALEGYDAYHACPDDIYEDLLDDPDNAVDRSIMKVAVNIMFNSSSVLQARRALQYHITKLSKADKAEATLLNANFVITTIFARYQDFEHIFCSDERLGLTLQYEDSNIAAEVVDVFVKAQQGILVVHDSFLCARKNMNMLIDAMANAFRNRYSLDHKIPMTIEYKEADGEYVKRKIQA